MKAKTSDLSQLKYLHAETEMGSGEFGRQTKELLKQHHRTTEEEIQNPQAFRQRLY